MYRYIMLILISWWLLNLIFSMTKALNGQNSSKQKMSKCEKDWTFFKKLWFGLFRNVFRLYINKSVKAICNLIFPKSLVVLRKCGAVLCLIFIRVWVKEDLLPYKKCNMGGGGGGGGFFFIFVLDLDKEGSHEQIVQK